MFGRLITYIARGTCCVLLGVLAALMPPGCAQAWTYDFRGGDSDKHFSVEFEMPIDIIVDNSDNEWLRINGFEDWSEFYYDGIHTGHISLTDWPFANTCAEEIEKDAPDPSSGATEVFRRDGILECTVSYENADGIRDAYWFFWHPDCPCFVRMHATVYEDDSDSYTYMAQPVIDAFRDVHTRRYSNRTLLGNMITHGDPTIPEDAVDLNAVMLQMGEAQARTRAAKAKQDALTRRLRARAEARKAAARAEAAPVIPSDVVSFQIENGTGKQMYVKFFEYLNKSARPGGTWPDSSRAYVLQGGEQSTYRLRCTPGRLVCMAAEFQNDPKSSSGIFWGVALQGDKGCSGCCLTCGGVQTGHRLVWDGKRHPPSDDGVGQILGVIAGIALGAALDTSGGAAPPPPRAAPPRYSGISGN